MAFKLLSTAASTTTTTLKKLCSPTFPHLSPALQTHLQSTKCIGSGSDSGSRPSSVSCSTNSAPPGGLTSLVSTFQSDRLPPVSFPPSIWGNYFASFSFNHLEFESLERRVEILREKVRKMLAAPADDPVKRIELIDTLSRLGVSYHFESEIEDQLTEMFEYFKPCLLEEHSHDIHTVALIFRVFRQHGYKIPCDVFKKFKGSDGKFKEPLQGDDAKAMLSLYEASHLSTPGEYILDEALAFSKAYLLKSLTVQSSNPQISRQIDNALKQPLHTGFERLEARKYIDFYEEDKNKNQTLLNLAKLDYNRVQLLHQQELSYLSKWWKELNLEKQLSYARERMVELFFWMVGLHFEPHYARARIMGTKNLILLSIVDDTYDSYGTIEELQSFTEAIQRWDASALDQLPDYMKILYKALSDTFKEFDKDMTAEERCYGFNCTRDAVKELVRAYDAEAQWFNEGYVPTFEEYMKIASVTSGILEIAAISFMGMGKIAGIMEFEWLQSKSKILTSSAIIGRLRDDISDGQAEQRRVREHVASSVECHMNQYGVSRNKAIEELERKIADAWKELNEECIRPTQVSINLLKLLANTARIPEVCHKYVDGYTNPIYLKDSITNLFITPIPTNCM